MILSAAAWLLTSIGHNDLAKLNRVTERFKYFYRTNQLLLAAKRFSRRLGPRAPAALAAIVAARAAFWYKMRGLQLLYLKKPSF